MPEPQDHTMICVAISDPGPPSVLVPETRDLPEPGPGDVIIRVVAAGVNYPDVLQRQGRYAVPPGASDLPGLEVAGTIAAVGSDVQHLKVGDAVCALTPGGGYAEYCRTPAQQCLPIPQNVTMTEAATLPEVYFTIWFNLAIQGDLLNARRLLIHGGSGGIGSAAIQLGSALGIEVFTTVSNEQDRAYCRDLGAAVVINYREEDFVEVVKQRTGGEGVDLVLDIVGGDYIQRNIDCLAQKGRLVNLYYLQGSKVGIDMMPVLVKNLILTGSLLRPQPLEVKAEIGKGLIETVWPLFAEGSIRSVVSERFPLEDAAGAHQMMESSKHSGKIVLETDYGKSLR
ncbi:NAD(P)H-quinone oxidoreductase [Paracoccus tegillarcae]|uniref:NAD(P)H-quinone oxidoreductase n=1 Tax=Paracoccus tegillarcae TaxID=1529068 RepID=A0A2K9EFC8_9RHOB|nr:NAD(P)H-quinone oxidoreductase [Paracoccus tegillarcae]AUH33660.1 NAD(P)H-quinone oxidoreductase [Paracoccus tegillarcae]